VVPPGSVLLRIDLKKFLLSGDAESLAQICSSIEQDTHKRTIIYDVVFFLLYQYMYSDKRDPDEVYRVVKGTAWVLSIVLKLPMLPFISWLSETSHLSQIC
jgi:hypothetical protein